MTDTKIGQLQPGQAEVFVLSSSTYRVSLLNSVYTTLGDREQYHIAGMSNKR